MKVAVVGSGCAGLAATWLLNGHSDHEVHLYEKDNRPGGHANTVSFTAPETRNGTKDVVDVDSGFIVFNPTTYPNFLRFLKNRSEDVKIDKTEMTFSVSRDAGAFEWAGDNLFTVFCQPKRLLDANMWRMIWDVLRFNASARQYRWETAKKDMSIGEYLQKEGYSDAFRDDYLIPMTAAIWSTPPDKCALDFPAQTLIQFLHNHHLLQLTGKPKWLTLQGGSKTYVQSIVSALPESQLHLSANIDSIHSCDGKVVLTMHNGQTETFDHVVMACHSDTSMKLRDGDLSAEEHQLLSQFKWNQNEVVMHSDVSMMPRSRLAWSCWNYLTFSTKDAAGRRQANVDKVSLTYGMNDLQHIDEKRYGPVLLTLNPPSSPDPRTIQARFKYEHPILDAAAIQAQRRMQFIQGVSGVSYAGAWLNFGFHEDAWTSGLLAATRYAPRLAEGIRLPWDIELVEGSSWAETKVKVDKQQGVVVALLALVFALLEGSGLRGLIGFIFGVGLGMIKFILDMFLSERIRFT